MPIERDAGARSIRIDPVTIIVVCKNAVRPTDGRLADGPHAQFDHVTLPAWGLVAHGAMRCLGEATDALAVDRPGAQHEGANLAARTCVVLRMHNGHEGSDKGRMYGPWL